ncbi:hypothetical protein KGF57_001309 [Candida theae]|uniref:Uncharacterized protein n=1 Tax=Candida theae TaxID=1198502 RepID=A0AAD5G016_9ASCO|nr:uncharacterized protein KGF57_001309 [Candida theae]KAI5963364.1 hypothetical protein KGF57_001309 [Candida theae]
MYSFITISSQEGQGVSHFNNAYVSDSKENDDYGFTLIESALSELKDLVSYVDDKNKTSAPPTQAHPNTHFSAETRTVKSQHKATAFYPVFSQSTSSNVSNTTTHTKSAFTKHQHGSNDFSSKRLTKSKMRREEDEDVGVVKGGSFYPLDFKDDDKHENDTSMVIESSKMMLARTKRHTQQPKQNQTSFSPSTLSILNKNTSTNCFNPQVSSFNPRKPSTAQKSKYNKINSDEPKMSSTPSLVTGPVRRFATPWDDCGEDDVEAAVAVSDPNGDKSKNGSISSIENAILNYRPPQPPAPMKWTPEVLLIGGESDSGNKVKFNNKMEVRQFSNDKHQDFTRVIEGKNKDKKLRRKWSWGSKRKAPTTNIDGKPSILKRTGWVPGEYITDEVVPIFSPDTESGRVALQLGLDLDEEEETEDVCPAAMRGEYATTIRCDLWDDDEEEEEEWRPDSRYMADTPMKMFKARVRRFVSGVKIYGEKLQSLMSLHTHSSGMSGSANQSFASSDLGEDDSGDETEGYLTVAPTSRPMMIRQ